MEREDKQPLYEESNRQRRLGWSRSKNEIFNSTSLNSTASSLWSCNTSSLASDILMEPYKSCEYNAEKPDRKPCYTPTIVVNSPDIHGNYMTSSSSFMSSSQVSNDRMTSSQDNGPSSDTSTPDGNQKTFPLKFRSEPKFNLRKSSDDDDFEEKMQNRNLRLRRKPSPRRFADKQKNNLPSQVSSYSSPYPSSVTSSSRHSSNSDDAFSDHDQISSCLKQNIVDDVFNHNLKEEKKNLFEKAAKLTMTEDGEMIEGAVEEFKGVNISSKMFCCPECRFQEQNNNIAVFNVAGKIFEVNTKILEKYPNTLLGNPGKRMRYYDWRRQEYFFDRHRDTFQVILDFYLNGGVLQRPDEIPIDIFINELKFYHFDHSTLEQFLRDEGILHVEKKILLPNTRIKRYIWDLFENHDSCLLSKIITVFSALVISISVIVFCLETMENFKPLSRDATLGPALNMCQEISLNDTSTRFEDDCHKKTANYQQLHLKLKENDKHLIISQAPPVNESVVPLLNFYSVSDITTAITPELEECKKRMGDFHFKSTIGRCLIELRDERKKLNLVYKKINVSVSNTFDSSISTAPVASSAHRLRHKQLVDPATTLNKTDEGTLPFDQPISSNFAGEYLLDQRTKKLSLLTNPTQRPQLFYIIHQACILLDKVSKKTPYEWFVLEAVMGSPSGILFIIETTCIMWFVVELTLRFLCCPDRKKFLKSFLNLIDALAILPYFITLLVTTIESKTHVKPQTATILRTIRLVRMLRILKLSRYSRGFRILGLTLMRSTRVLFLLVCFQVVLAVLFSSIAYFMEFDSPGTQFHSIPESFWWALITMTTVGYGDITPITVLGKCAGACCAIMGILSISFPVPVVVSNFNYLYNLDKEKFKLVPQDLMENEEERLENADRFRDNLFDVMKRSASGLTSDKKSTNNPAESWNLVRKAFRKMSLASIDARLEKSPSRTMSGSHSTTTPIKSVLNQPKKKTVRATSV